MSAGQKIYEVTRRGGQNCWLAADSIREAQKKATTYFNKNYVKPNVIEKIELAGTVDA